MVIYIYMLIEVTLNIKPVFSIKLREKRIYQVVTEAITRKWLKIKACCINDIFLKAVEYSETNDNKFKSL